MKTSMTCVDEAVRYCLYILSESEYSILILFMYDGSLG